MNITQSKAVLPLNAKENVSLIGIDWGSTGLRIFLIGQNGQLIDSREAASGISVMQGGQAAYVRELQELAGDWLTNWPDVPLLACGMVGSKHGWQEVPYVQSPADAHDIAINILSIDAGNLRSVPSRLGIVPGLLYRGDAPDVMRGEETQIVGALQGQPDWASRSCIVMPGTHSKWASIVDGKVQAFATHMTGELFAVLKQHSVLGRLMPAVQGESSDASFVAGLDVARKMMAQGLSHQLFSVRTLGLMGDMPPDGLADYLSGLLIANELLAGLHWRSEHGLAHAPLILIGDASLCGRYSLALSRFGFKPDAVLLNSAPAGLWHLAFTAGMLRS
ncbi:2-dehydro-3-deoxygalactonokinase [Undibacterium sp. KW1]|uniref:2-dehydro-3-deoxygalactonokinase n=1 Tax=Undibacterium sp. KW1 TaxID=2058624 RepID=UPI00138A29CE|nr:2-dehydro-3-deoxygalactonokinase [Undibacterium sp. KW1]